MKFSRAIQYLRAVAAFAVVIFHITKEVSHGLTVGAAGVDVFFVISGFIMASIVAARPMTPFAFMRDRLIRIVPSYWILTLFRAALAAVIPSLAARFVAAPGHLILSLAFIPHLDPQGENLPILKPGWTLNYEMFFYALMTAALCLPAARRMGTVIAALIGLTVAGALVTFTNPALMIYTSPLLLEFAAGMALSGGWIARVLPNRHAGWAALGAGALGFLAQAIWPVESLWFLDHAGRVIAWGLPAFCLVAGALTIEAHGGVTQNRLGLALGDASYSIYLSHGLVISACMKGLGGAPIPVLLIVTLVCTAAAGLAYFRLVERPLMLALKGQRPKPAVARFIPDPRRDTAPGTP